MGGDFEPELVVQAAAGALTGKADLEIVLLGPRDLIEEKIASLDHGQSWAGRLVCGHAPEVIGMDESPVEAVRRKKNATIMVGFDLHRRGEVDAVVSAGNSGATMAAAVRTLGRLKGVGRPGIGAFFPTLKEPVMVMDIGANVDCRPVHLLQFAIMASSCSRLLQGVTRPRVGLLSIGEEAGKGNAQVRETHELLSTSTLNYIGNVEGRDVYRGDVDVIVCDGFVGNISLKISEGLAEAALRMLRQEIGKSWRARIGYLLARPAFHRFRRRIDYAEYGGAPLLGINGTGIICHGSSDIRAIRNAIFLADDMARQGLNQAISQALIDQPVQGAS